MFFLICTGDCKAARVRHCCSDGPWQNYAAKVGELRLLPANLGLVRLMTSKRAFLVNSCLTNWSLL